MPDMHFSSWLQGHCKYSPLSSGHVGTAILRPTPHVSERAAELRTSHQGCTH